MLINLVSCDEASKDDTPEVEVSNFPAAPELSRERVPTESFHLVGLSPKPRFIKNTTTGGFRVRPRYARPGQRLRLSGSGCNDANSVFVVLFRREPLLEGAHDRKQTWINTKRSESNPSGGNRAQPLGQPRPQACSERGRFVSSCDSRTPKARERPRIPGPTTQSGL